MMHSDLEYPELKGPFSSTFSSTRYRVWVDDETAIGNVEGWYMSGNYLILNFPDGSAQGITGFVNFWIEPEDES